MLWIYPQTKVNRDSRHKKNLVATIASCGPVRGFTSKTIRRIWSTEQCINNKFLSLLTLLPGRHPNRLMEPSLPFVSDENCTPLHHPLTFGDWIPAPYNDNIQKKTFWNPSAVRPIAAFVISVAFFGVGVDLGNPAFTSSRWYKVGP